MELSYTMVGDFQIPNLMLDSQPPGSIGKYGRMRKRYLKEQHPVLFSELLLSGQLFPHLVEIDQTCEARIELLVKQMSGCEGVTEALKAANQMEWVAHMNSIRSRAEEIVLHELVYPEEAENADT